MTKIKQMMSGDAVWMPKQDWHDRFNSLKNVPPIFRMVWEAAPGVVAASLLCRLTAAMLPVARPLAAMKDSRLPRPPRRPLAWASTPHGGTAHGAGGRAAATRPTIGAAHLREQGRANRAARTGRGTGIGRAPNHRYRYDRPGSLRAGRVLRITRRHAQPDRR